MNIFAKYLTIGLCALPYTLNAHSPAFSPVVNPTVPPTIQFCGQNISLDRFDRFERLDRELTSLIYGHSNTLLTVKRANKYFPAMAKILKEEGLPHDMLYLACVESYLSPRAYSPAKAAGIWQFIPATAKQYGLEVNDEVDERYHIEKATRAACRYLKAGYKRFGDWPSVMAAYNGGTARITSELDKQGVATSLDLHLAEETTRYPYRIMAMKIVMENLPAFGFHLSADQLYQPVECQTIEVTGPVDDWASWAMANGTTYAILREENPWIRSRQLTNKENKTYQVRVPLKGANQRSTAHKHTYSEKWIHK